MDKNKLPKLKSDSNVHIEQVNKQRELNDLEKTAVMQFLIDEQEKDLTKTQQLKILNSKKKKVVTEVELPKMDTFKSTSVPKEESLEIEMPKKVNNLSNTIKIKLSDLRAAVQKREQEAKVQEKEVPKKKSLYDTIIIKLDDIINNRKALKSVTSLKVVDVNIPLHGNTKKRNVRVKDITKVKEFKLNVDSEEFMSQMNNLNIIALNRLSSKKTVEVRSNADYKRNHAFENTKVHKEDYLAFKNELIEFAIDKLYYQYALKETKKYKMYKTSVALSVVVFLVTSFVIFSWFIQGVTINNLSNSLTEVAPVEKVEDGSLVNVELIEDIPTNEDGTLDKEAVKQNDMYWKYLNTPLSSIDFTELLKQNKDTVGWLIVNNTNVDYPVVQTTDNDYYLNHAFDKSVNSAGWVYADYRNEFDEFNQNTVIYAHGRKDGVMFGSLVNTLNKDWYTNTDNQIIQLSTLGYDTMWQIFSVYKVKAETYYITTDFSSDASYQTFIKEMVSRSIYDFNVDVTTDDKLLTLSTCYNDYGMRLVVQAKLVKIQKK